MVYNVSTATTAASTVAADKYTWNQHYVRHNTYSFSSGTAGTTKTTIARGCGLAAKAFAADLNSYVPVVRESIT